MKIQRFLLPAILAAALHAALLFALPDTEIDAVIRPPTVQLVPLPPMPRYPVEPLEKPEPALAPVTPVAAAGEGGLPRPTLPETFTRDPVPFEIESGRPSPTPAAPLSHLMPGTSGPGTGVEGWGPGGSPWIDAALLDRTPRARAQPAPDYPPALRRELAEGEVLVELDVDALGRVTAARVIAADRREFAEAALRAVLRWRFEPGRRDGRPVAFRLRLPIGFSLRVD